MAPPRPRQADYKRLLASFERARATRDLSQLTLVYARRAVAEVVDAIPGDVHIGPEGVKRMLDREHAAYAPTFSYPWTLFDLNLGTMAVVERVDGESPTTHRRVGFYRLHVLTLDAGGTIERDLIAFDPATVAGQLGIGGEADKIRSPDTLTDFGSAVPHGSTPADLHDPIIPLVDSFDRAFPTGDVQIQVDALAPTAVYTDFTVPGIMDKQGFGTLLTGFYRAFDDVELTPVSVWAAGRWALDHFRWQATFKANGARVELDDYVILEFDDSGLITRSITFKNNAALQRQIAPFGLEKKKVRAYAVSTTGTATAVKR